MFLGASDNVVHPQTCYFMREIMINQWMERGTRVPYFQTKPHGKITEYDGTARTWMFHCKKMSKSQANVEWIQSKYFQLCQEQMLKLGGNTVGKSWKYQKILPSTSDLPRLALIQLLQGFIQVLLAAGTGWNRRNKWSTWKADESWTTNHHILYIFSDHHILYWRLMYLDLMVMDSRFKIHQVSTHHHSSVPSPISPGCRPQLLTCRPWEPVCISLHIMRRNCSRHQLSRSWPWTCPNTLLCARQWQLHGWDEPLVSFPKATLAIYKL